MPFGLEFWKQWEGQSVDVVYPLELCIGEGSRGAVFETRFQGRPAAIKIVPGTSESIDALRKLWKRSAGLSHPALVRIFAQGVTAFGDLRCAYAVMERADENLADVLADRSLTPDETREMLFPLLDALRYLHAKGFAHGALKPPNIGAFGEQLKISSDGLVPGGDPAADSAAIGAVLEEVLGAGRNALPEPFAEIARNCQLPNPFERWNVARIEACLRGGEAPAAPGRSRFLWWSLAAAAVAILGLIASWPSQTGNSNPKVAAPAPMEVATPPPTAPDSKPLPKATVAKAPKKDKPPAAQRPATLDAGVTRVLPDIPQGALNTITGRVRINVRVRVDSEGNVSQAALEPPLASKYFCDRVLAAARAWKFPAGDAPRDWALHFDLTREQMRVSQAKIEN